MLHEDTGQLSPPNPRRSTTPRPRHTSSLHTPSCKPPLPTQRQDSSSSSELLRQLNSISRTTYILTASRSHTRRLPCLLVRTVTLSLQINTSSVQPTNTHDAPRFIKPVRRYFPPHHTTSSSHQPNPLQHGEKTPPPPPAMRHAQVITVMFTTPPSFHTLTRPHWTTHLQTYHFRYSTLCYYILYYIYYIVFYLT